MLRRLVTISACGFIILGKTSAQEVIIVRESKPEIATVEVVATRQASGEVHMEKTVSVQPAKPLITTAQPSIVQTNKPSVADSQPAKPPARSSQSAPLVPSRVPPDKLQKAANVSLPSVEQDRKTEAIRSASLDGATAFTRLADGFDFPVGKPDARGYYKAQGFRAHGHLGEDWDGIRGGDTDLGDSIYCIGDGVVVFARDCKMGWGNVIIVRHAFREGGTVKSIDSFYGHLQRILVHRGQAVARGQQIATMGNAHGLYDAHLHFEIRKNIEIGMSRAAFAHDFNNYYDPSQFISSHRNLRGGGGTYRIAMDTFHRDQAIRWDRKRYFSGYHSSGGDSALALKKALASQAAATR